MIRKFTEHQKKSIIFIAAITGTLKNPDFWKDWNVSSEMQKQINVVTEASNKLCGMFNLAHEEGNYIHKLIQDGEYSLDCFSRTDYTLYLKKYKSQTINVKRDELFDILTYAVQYCEVCKVTNPKKCKLRQLLKKFDIPAYDPMGLYKCEYCTKK